LAKAHEVVRRQAFLSRAAITVGRKGAVSQRRAAVEAQSLPMRLVPDLENAPHSWPRTWNLVKVGEPAPPAEPEPVHWLLWMLNPAAMAAKALEVVRKYMCRWPIAKWRLTA
jgi:hypothetical protein